MIRKVVDWLRRKPIIVREGDVATIAEVLFPDPEEVTKDSVTIIVDRSVDANLQAALIDLEDGQNDVVTRETIRKCIAKLVEARNVLQANPLADKRARYLLVDMPDSKDPGI